MSKIRMAALLGMVAMLAACSEYSAAPRNDAASSVAGGGATAALTSTDTIRFSITIEPWHTTYYNLGSGNSLTFPAHSLCDPWRSSYGPGVWDQPCVASNAPLTVNAKAWLDSNGHARVDFDKHVRFVPSNNPAQWVVITFADLQASLDPFFNILYCPYSTGGCYDESRLDPSLATLRDPVTGRVTRRIKHFSGYNVAAGEEDNGVDPTASNNLTIGNRSLSVSTKDLQLDDLESVSRAYPDLTPSEVDAMLSLIRTARKFSGYILASG